ncbi:sterol delta 5,6-desaturase ERG3, partial [Listeria marthii FSL S4-120]
TLESFSQMRKKASLLPTSFSSSGVFMPALIKSCSSTLPMFGNSLRFAITVPSSVLFW